MFTITSPFDLFFFSKNDDLHNRRKKTYIIMLLSLGFKSGIKRDQLLRWPLIRYGLPHAMGKMSRGSKKKKNTRSNQKKKISSARRRRTLGHGQVMRVLVDRGSTDRTPCRTSIIVWRTSTSGHGVRPPCADCSGVACAQAFITRPRAHRYDRNYGSRSLLPRLVHHPGRLTRARAATSDLSHTRRPDLTA